MQAVVLEEHGSPDILQVSKIPDLEPGREQVRVKVAASAVIAPMLCNARVIIPAQSLPI
jgi:NADPH:quinone reductase-like Zn-dependent oxidoreductase